MVRIGEYLNENQIWVGPFHTFEIDEVIETEEEGRQIIVILLDCCGTGDRAAIDKETGEVIFYAKGVW